MQPARYVWLFADADGESHFADVDVPLAAVDFAPPAPPLHVADLFPASRCSFISSPADWDGSAPHPSPRRQLFCNLRGQYEITASDGETRLFTAGSVLLLDDTVGKGHSTRAFGDEQTLIVCVTLAD